MEHLVLMKVFNFSKNAQSFGPAPRSEIRWVVNALEVRVCVHWFHPSNIRERMHGQTIFDLGPSQTGLSRPARGL